MGEGVATEQNKNRLDGLSITVNSFEYAINIKSMESLSVDSMV